MVYLGIDCGTQGTKAILWDPQQSNIISSSYHSYEVISSHNGRKEQDPEVWVNAAKLTVKQAIMDSGILPHEIKAIGVSGQQHGLILLDKNNHVLCPAKLWCDTEPAQDLQQFLSSFTAHSKKNIHELTGIHVPVAFTLAKLVWIKNHRPEILPRIDKILLPHEYINFWLTGDYCAEGGDASGTGYFDTRDRCWSKDIIDYISPGLFEKLPSVISSEMPSGFLSTKAAKILGLPSGMPVSSGGGDNMMAAIGTGNISPGILTLSLGTSGTLFTCTDCQVENHQRPDINSFCSSTNSWLPLISTMNVTNAVNAFRDVLNISLDEFDDILLSSSPGAGGLYCFPWFNGSRYPDVPDARGSLHGITTHNFIKSNLLRCVVESVTYKICKGIKEFRRQGLAFTQIRVIGGGAKSTAWCQMIADITGLEVIRPPVTEAAALGAALQARWCHETILNPEKHIELRNILPEFLSVPRGDIFRPDQELHEVYAPLYSKFHERLQEIVKLAGV
ncbi:xylulokinase [Klebsiella variicola]|nr:xylulokinase [Klebsiella variicola]